MEKSAQQKKETLRYFVSQKGRYCVVGFEGELDRSSEDVISRLMTELLAQSSTCFVFTLHGVMRADYLGIAAFVRLQKSIRDRGSHLRVCAIPTDVEQILRERGAVRQGEFLLDLAESLKSFPPEDATKAS